MGEIMNLKNKEVLFSIQEHQLLQDDIKQNILNILNSETKELKIINGEFNGGDKKIFYKLFNSINKRIKIKKIEEIFIKYQKQRKRNGLKKYGRVDYILFISGISYSKDFLILLKEAYPKAKMILFLWDKLEYSAFKGKEECFDYIFSYDRIDCLENDFIFRPTFYVDKCLENIPSKKEYDFYYIGVLRDEKRYQYVKWLKDYLEENKLKIFLKLYTGKITGIENLKQYLPLKYDEDLITTKGISYNENIEILKNSNVVLDLKYKDQKGLTLRCYEAIATETKIITDNEDIVNYDFYNENNIKVIKNIEDVKNIPLEFFKTPAEKIDDKTKERYSIKGFLKEIFEEVEKNTKDKM